MFIGGKDIVSTSSSLGTIVVPASNSEYYAMVDSTLSTSVPSLFFTQTVPFISGSDYTNMDASGNRCIGVVRTDNTSDFYEYIDPSCHTSKFRDNQIHSDGSGNRIASCILDLRDTGTIGTFSYTMIDGECISSIDNSAIGVHQFNFRSNYWYGSPACIAHVHDATAGGQNYWQSIGLPSSSYYTVSTRAYAGGALIDVGMVVKCIGKVNF
jgi:hypothetical protein